MVNQFKSSMNPLISSNMLWIHGKAYPTKRNKLYLHTTNDAAGMYELETTNPIVTIAFKMFPKMATYIDGILCNTPAIVKSINFPPTSPIPHMNMMLAVWVRLNPTVSELCKKLPWNFGREKRKVMIMFYITNKKNQKAIPRFKYHLSMASISRCPAKKIKSKIFC